MRESFCFNIALLKPFEASGHILRAMLYLKYEISMGSK